MISAAVLEWVGPLAPEEDADRLKRRGPEALGALIELYQHRLYRYLLRLVRDPAAAEDLFQQTWLRVMEKIHQYDSRRSFDSWLFAVAHNLALDHLRVKRPESLEEPETTIARGTDALEGLLEWERAELLGSKMAQLPAIHREVLSLRFEEGMKLEEIAAVLAIPLSTVKSRLGRALESLRALLGVKP
jgi:RNA polymerase sigma-70 factor (ECF subfamily)